MEDRGVLIQLTAAPNRLPTNDVSAIAAAPPMRTRAVARARGAPPSRAPVAPSVAPEPEPVAEPVPEPVPESVAVAGE